MFALLKNFIVIILFVMTVGSANKHLASLWMPSTNVRNGTRGWFATKRLLVSWNSLIAGNEIGKV